jgi:hypothetical protein
MVQTAAPMESVAQGAAPFKRLGRLKTALPCCSAPLVREQNSATTSP